ncbi:response regulator transcription factor [Planctomonas sp. JC2975]|nr:response regulator transcription factor [Planctomonas sp. JC2975]NNC13725.1 response regulator transcription factor [Planctomonas sp. JC2975]
MLDAYPERFAVVELDANLQVSNPVDIALYDTFANPQGDRDQVRELAANPLVGSVAVYSWNIDDDLVAAALANGADGYISKGLPAADIAAALEAIHGGSGHVYVPSSGSVAAAGDWPGREEGLSQREAEILALITQGLSNEAIAERAHLSINSVKTYIRSCYRRIGVASRIHAVLWGIEHGFRPDRVRIEPGRRD